VAYVQAATLKDTVLPEAEQAFSLSRQGYESGKFAYLEVLDAQRTLAEARLQFIEALQEYHTQRANVERLTATQLHTSTKQEESREQM
jgi:cobalt-zinc-cadmium efflux system outer membrane protein